MTVHVEVVRVFATAGGQFGNPLGIVSADALPPSRWQELAAQLGFSETVFVGHPISGVARLRIFTPTQELPFAGHPTVGTAWWLANLGTPVTALSAAAGEVAVRYSGERTWVRARAEWAPEFVFHQLGNASEVNSLRPADFPSALHYAWAWTADGAIRARMFAPGLGIAEDEATGAAAIRITDQLATSLIITQGAGSQLFTQYEPGGWIQLGGRAVAEKPLEIELPG